MCKYPAHELLVKTLRTHLGKKRLSPTQMAEAQYAVATLQKLQLGRVELMEVIASLEPLAKGRLINKTLLSKPLERLKLDLLHIIT